MNNPDDLRLAVRNARYDNTQSEQENIARVDEELFDRARVFERQLIDAGQTVIDTNEVHLLAANELVPRLRNEITHALGERTAEPDGPTADKFRTLQALTNQAIAALERAAREAEWAAARADDPWASYVELLRKWPILARVTHI